MNIQHSNILRHGSQRLPSSVRRGRGAGGFTLVELMVVLGIMAIITAITVGSFRSLTDNNQRTACQANLQQVYQGLRLYMADESGQAPLFDPSGDPPPPAAPTNVNRNIGLWNLWTFPEPGKEYNIAPVGSAPIGRYLRSTNVFHCPADVDSGIVRAFPGDLYTDANKTAYNPDFLSYQMYAYDKNNKGENIYSSSDSPSDPGYGDDRPNLTTYLPVRTTDTSNRVTFQRQLKQPKTPIPAAPALPYYKRPPLDSAVVTWCRHHRYVRDYDNVLFFDGSVQLLPRAQDNLDASCNIDGTTPTLMGASRVHRRADCGQ